MRAGACLQIRPLAGRMLQQGGRAVGRGIVGFSSGEFVIYEFFSLDPVDMETLEVVPDPTHQ